MKFNSLDLQKNIEEKRLIFGIKLTTFLQKNLFTFFSFLKNSFNNFLSRKDSVFLGCFFIISLAAIILSGRDIGYDSAIYIEIANKMLEGKKYYYDFFENNFPLAFFITIIPVSLAKILELNAIITTQAFVFFVGILSIFSCTKILQKKPETPDFAEQNYERNLLLISLCLAYFFRIYVMQFGEYTTKTSYFLALALPYICLHLKPNFSTKRQIFSATLAALIICLKPHYAILIAIFEITKFYNFLKNYSNKISDKKKYSPLLNFSIITSILAIYAASIQKFTPEYFQFLTSFSALYFKVKYIDLASTLRENAYPLAFLFMIFSHQKEDKIFRTFSLAIIAMILIVLSEILGGKDHRFIIFAIALPFIITQFHNLVKKNRIKYDKNLFLCLPILILPQFDSNNFFNIALNLCYFWWISLFYIKKPSFLLIFAAFLSFILIFFAKNSNLPWIFCALITLFLFKKTPKFDKDGFLNTKALFTLTLVLSYLLALFLSATFNYKKLLFAEFQGPSAINSAKIALIKKYAPSKNDKVIFIADEIPEAYPALIYAQKQNPTPALRYLVFYEKINEKEFAGIKNQAFNHLFSSLKKQLSDKNSKIVFIKKNINPRHKCQINFLEHYLKDEEFRDEFLNNYKFLTQIHHKVKIETEEDIFTNKTLDQIKPSKEVIYGEIEVYIRKK